MASPLLQFLARARSAALRPTSPTTTTITLVLGNPSCDLDSFISATIYSFFHSHRARRLPSAQQPHLHIPILNLPSTLSTELWRLRPEFGTALRLALHGHDQAGIAMDDGGVEAEATKSLLENLVTVSDIRSDPSSSLHHVFSKLSTTTHPPLEDKIQAVLVDHNALSVPLADVSSPEISSRIDITGCIDHHIDESFTPNSASPRIIRTGIGSCTSLVVQYLKGEGLWADLLNQGNDDPAAAELAKLSLAAVLIDTGNLTAEGKVSDVDRETVNFLEEVISNSSTSSQQDTHQQTTQQTAAKWDRKSFYEQIASSKANSLSLLSLREIFERDYKTWSEKPPANTLGTTELHLGIASIVKPISWLISKADDDSSVQEFVSALGDFATSQDPGLDLFALMTTSTDAEGAFRRELLLLDTAGTEGSRRAVQKFEQMAARELGLEKWEEVEGLVRALDWEGEGRGDGKEGSVRGGGIRGRIWRQRDTSKSRKQVAPLLRDAMKSA